MDSCDVWLMCLFVDPDTLEGTCVELCQPWQDLTCMDETQTCVVFNDGVLPICADPCHPLTAPCPAGQVCVADAKDGIFVCMPDAWPGTGLGEPCDVTHGCGVGAYCEDDDKVPGCTDPSHCCAEYCDLTAPACTDPGATCQPFYEGATAPAGFEDLGACRLP